MDGSGISSRFASEKSIQEAQERRKEGKQHESLYYEDSANV
jgi:hypothetical protein